MNSAIKKPTWKRLGLGLLQHIISLGAFLMVAAILFNSYLSVGSMEGRKTYYLDPLSAPEEFENSAVFQDIFQTLSAHQKSLFFLGQMPPGCLLSSVHLLWNLNSLLDVMYQWKKILSELLPPPNNLNSFPLSWKQPILSPLVFLK